MTHERSFDVPSGRDRAQELALLLAGLWPAAEAFPAAAPLAAALDGLLEELVARAEHEVDGLGAAGARGVAAALVAAGASGAEVWHHAGPPEHGWRRLAGAGSAVPDAAWHVGDRPHGFPGAVGVVRSGAHAVVFGGAMPGSDLWERCEDLAAALLAATAACSRAGSGDDSGAEGERRGADEGERGAHPA